MMNFASIEKVISLGELYKFDNTKCPLNTNLPIGYIFNLKENNRELTILFSKGTGKDKEKFFPTSFFANKEGDYKYGKYIENQTNIKIDKIRTTNLKTQERNIFRESQIEKSSLRER